MAVELWDAILNPRGPNYEHWHAILGDRHVPLTSSASMKAELGAEKDVEVYMLDLRALSLSERARLLSIVAKRFGVTVAEVEAEITARGFPIRAADVIVSYDMRAFV